MKEFGSIILTDIDSLCCTLETVNYTLFFFFLNFQ